MSEKKYAVEIKLTAKEIIEIVDALPLAEQLEIAKEIVCQLSDSKEAGTSLLKNLAEFINEP